MKPEKRMKTLVALLAAFLATAAFSVAQNSKAMNYQGVLQNADGEDAEGGTYVMRFTIHTQDNGGATRWNSGELNVAVSNGQFNVALGIDPANPFGANVFNGEDRWLQVVIVRNPQGANVNSAILPRQVIASAPYAIRADRAEVAEVLEGMSADGRIGSDLIANDAIDSAHIANDAIDSAQIADDAIDSAHIANDAIDSAQIADDAIENHHIATNAVSKGSIRADAVGHSEILENAVRTSEIEDGAVTTDDIKDYTISNRDISGGSVDADRLSGGYVGGTTSLGLPVRKIFGLSADTIRMSQTGTLGRNAPKTGQLEIFYNSNTTSPIAYIGPYDNADNYKNGKMYLRYQNHSPPRVELEVWPDAVGRVYVNGNNGDRNVALTATSSNKSNGYIGVGNSGGTYKARMYVDTEGAGVVSVDELIESSDRRLKEDIKPLVGALDSIMSIRGVSYLRRDLPEAGREIGVIAQEVQKVFPEIISEVEQPADSFKAALRGKVRNESGGGAPADKPRPGQGTVEGYDGGDDDTLGVSYTRLVPVLIEAIKEQQGMISELEERIKVLEGKRTSDP